MGTMYMPNIFLLSLQQNHSCTQACAHTRAYTTSSDQEWQHERAGGDEYLRAAASPTCRQLND